MTNNLEAEAAALETPEEPENESASPEEEAESVLTAQVTEREDIQEMASAAESLLFAAPEPLTLGDLRRILAVRPGTLERVLELLGRSLSEGKRGIRLQRHQDWVRLVTAPENAFYVDKMRGQQAGQRLSEAALETLALIAYRQPVTRPQIEAIRGVDCSGVVNTLLARGLVVEVGRLDTVGHPILYGTTLAFLQHFGLERPDQLPSIDDAKGAKVEIAAAQSTAPPREDGEGPSDQSDDALNDIPSAEAAPSGDTGKGGEHAITDDIKDTGDVEGAEPVEAPDPGAEGFSPEGE